MNQSDAFKSNEGDAWLFRNLDQVRSLKPESDILLQELKRLFPDFRGKSYLEVGCGNGYRLSWVKQLGGTVLGIEPGQRAVTDGRARYSLGDQEIVVSDARDFFEAFTGSSRFDVVCFAHCLYLIPPSQIPRIVSGAIDSLREGGYVLIYDFDPKPQSRDYHHLEGVKSYKADFSGYFTWVPFMRLIYKSVAEHGGEPSQGNPQEDCVIAVVRKIPVDYAFPQLLDGV